jgi:hypothetical protein
MLVCPGSGDMGPNGAGKPVSRVQELTGGPGGRSPRPRGEPGHRTVQLGHPPEQPRRAPAGQRIAQHGIEPARVRLLQRLAHRSRRAALPAPVSASRKSSGTRPARRAENGSAAARAGRGSVTTMGSLSGRAGALSSAQGYAGLLPQTTRRASAYAGGSTRPGGSPSPAPRAALAPVITKGSLCMNRR